MPFKINRLLKKIQQVTKSDIGITYISGGNLLFSLVGAIFWFTFASLLDAEKYGEVNYYLAVASVASTVSLLGLNTAVITFLAKGSEKFRYQANLVVVISNSVIFVVLATLMSYLPALVLVGASLFAMSFAELIGRQLYRKYFFLVVGERASQFVLSISLYFLIGLEGVLIGFTIAHLIFSYRFFKSTRHFSLSISELRSKFSFISHSYALGLSQSMILFVDKLIIGPLFGFAVLGIYQLGFQFLMFLMIIPISLYQYLLPYEAKGIRKKNVKILGIAISIAFAIIFSISSPIIIEQLFPDYTASIPVARVLSFGVIPMTISSIINSQFLGNEKSRPVVFGTAIYVISVLVLINLLGNMLDVIGLGYSVVISLSLQSTYLLLANYITTKRRKKNGDSG